MRPLRDPLLERREDILARAWKKIEEDRNSKPFSGVYLWIGTVVFWMTIVGFCGLMILYISNGR